MTIVERVEDVVAEEPRLAAAMRLARAGGRLARERFARAVVSWKPDDSMVTDADTAIQAMLQTELSLMFPDDAVVGEEGRALVGDPATAEHLWALDPVDGTNNFGRGIPGFSISLGVFRRERPVAGAVYDPIADQLFVGCVGRGAWLDGRPLRLDPAPLSRRSLCSIRSPYEERIPPFVADWLCRYRLRRTGSTALTLCYVGLGAIAFAYDHRAALWDIAGAVPVLLEAGGILTTPEGADLFPLGAAVALDSIAFLAGDPLAHHQSLQDIRTADPVPSV